MIGHGGLFEIQGRGVMLVEVFDARLMPTWDTEETSTGKDLRGVLGALIYTSAETSPDWAISIRRR